MKIYTVQTGNGCLFAKMRADSVDEVKKCLARSGGIYDWEAYCKFRHFDTRVRVFGHTIQLFDEVGPFGYR